MGEMNVRSSIQSIGKSNKGSSKLSMKKTQEGVDLTFARSTPITDNLPDKKKLLTQSGMNPELIKEMPAKSSDLQDNQINAVGTNLNSESALLSDEEPDRPAEIMTE